LLVSLFSWVVLNRLLTQE